MKVPASFCTICTNACAQELVGFLLSLSLHHRDAKVFINTDTETFEYIEKITPQPKLNISWNVCLDKYSNKSRYQMEQTGMFTDLVLEKNLVIHRALEHESDTMFIDVDTLILDQLFVDETKQLGVSPQFINDEEVKNTGYYNAGLIWTNQKDLPEKWKEFTKTSRYYEQASIEDLVKIYDTFEFGENYNLQTWRFRVGREDNVPHLTVKDGRILFKNQPLKFFHTHFNRDDHKEQNHLFIEKMSEAKLWKELIITFRVKYGKWCLVIPNQPMRGQFYHANDSYRELPILFSKKNIDVAMGVSNSEHCWLLPSVLLYDRPTLYWANQNAVNAHMTLLGNGDVNVEGKAFVNGVKPWIFWPRRPIVLEEHIDRLSWDERTTKSIFIGNFENDVQEKFRTGTDWVNAVTEYHCTAGTQHKFTQEEYLDMLKHSKFGLCLRGFGSKCHREVELMAMGTVPLITEHVSIDSYYDPPVEGKHYIRVDSPEDAKKKVEEIPKEKWEEMSKACHQWYLDNVHSDNAWQRMINYLLYDTI
jgi:hypothetical protein